MSQFFKIPDDLKKGLFAMEMVSEKARDREYQQQQYKKIKKKRKNMKWNAAAWKYQEVS